MTDQSERADYAQCPSDELAEAIGQVHALMAASHRTLLDLIEAYDRRERWREDGATDMAAWVCGRLGVTQATARRWVRAARRLAELPAIAAAFGGGRLSWDQVAALVRLATPETDAELAERAPGWSGAQVEQAARRARRVTAHELDDAQRGRSLRWWHDEHQSLRLAGRLPAADGAVVVKALERTAADAPRDPVTGTLEPFAARCADALVELASLRLAAEADADRATVVVHADARLLAGGDGVAEVPSSPATLHPEVARRLACDGRLQTVLDGGDGQPVGVGRTTRTVPPYLLRLLRRRDGHCTFPGCARHRWVQAHHATHWANGGPTNLGNLGLVCWFHHKLVHEGGWSMVVDPDGQVRFLRPGGTPHTDGPPGLRGDLRRRFFGEAPNPP